MSKGNILIQVTGSIAAYKTCQVISALTQEGFSIKTAATDGGLQFVGSATLEGLSGHPVFTNMHESGRAMDHIELARWADLLIVCPATANTINRLGAGLADDVVGALFLANNFKKPYWIFPAMNSDMYGHPATRMALQKLESWGTRVFPTQEGRLACGEQGLGKLLEPQIIIEEIQSFFSRERKK